MHTHKLFSSLVVACLLLAPFSATAQATDAFSAGVPFTKNLVITAYYSPKAGQCCYVTGSLESDVTLNGQGFHGADGTAVYPGMVAAPKSYPFGTRIVIDGLGTFTVHDRGGAIIEQGETHRLDVWAGEGEEGLARALAFGVKRLTATVYPPSTIQPPENFTLASLPAPLERLRPYFVEGTSLMDLSAALGDRTASVEALQEKLKALGVFSEASTGLFGPATQQALQAFLVRAGYASEPTDHLTETAAAAIEASLARKDRKAPLAERVLPGSPASEVASLQRTLRFLDLYDGRSNGVFNATLTQSLLALQKAHGLIADEKSPGAGTVGPKTRAVIVTLWNRKHVQMQASRLIAQHKIDVLIAERNLLPSSYLSKGEQGNPVAALQRFLAAKGFFDRVSVNGVFGDLTERAVLAYQYAAGIIDSDDDQGAGTFGPATRSHMQADMRSTLQKLVHSQGWEKAQEVI